METIAGLVNGVFLIFISYDILCESVERLFDPVKIHDDGLLTVSILGLLVNLLGLVFFHDVHHHSGPTECQHHDHDHDHEVKDIEGSAKSSGHSHKESNANMYGIYLHILADALGSVGVIVSSFLVKYYDMQIADPICSLLISALIVASVVPLI